MGKKKVKHLIAIDSETGIVWHDNRALRSQDLVNGAIRQANFMGYAHLSKRPFQESENKATGQCQI